MTTIVDKIDNNLQLALGEEFTRAAKILDLIVTRTEVFFPPRIDDFDAFDHVAIRGYVTLPLEDSKKDEKGEKEITFGVRLSFKLGETEMKDLMIATRNSAMFYILVNQHAAASHINQALQLFREYPQDQDILISAWKQHATWLMNETANNSNGSRAQARVPSVSTVRDGVNRYVLAKTKDWLVAARKYIVAINSDD